MADSAVTGREHQHVCEPPHTTWTRCLAVSQLTHTYNQVDSLTLNSMQKSLILLLCSFVKARLLSQRRHRCSTALARRMLSARQVPIRLASISCCTNSRNGSTSSHVAVAAGMPLRASAAACCSACCCSAAAAAALAEFTSCGHLPEVSARGQ